jgi:hypothetical protein
MLAITMNRISFSFPPIHLFVFAVDQINAIGVYSTAPKEKTPKGKIPIGVSLVQELSLGSRLCSLLQGV